jgi:6-phosphogluconolactonase
MEGQRVSGGGAPHLPSRREVRVLEDAVDLTRAAAAEVVGALARRGDDWRAGSASGASAAPFPTIALAGGSTPRALYRLLADPAAPFRARVDWEAVRYFWGDERHVPPDDPDSNFRMAREAMLDHVQAPAAHVHRIAGEEPDAARAARLYERELIEVFGLRRDRGNGKDESAGAAGDAGAAAREWPRFDLVLLGMGEEGHTASLFPGSPLLADSELPRPSAQEPLRSRRPQRPRRLAAAVWVEKLNTWRITLTPDVLDHAATVIFLISGAAKAAALAAVLEGEWRPELYPAQVVAPVDGRLLWLVDRAAAAQLRRL